MDHAIKVNFPGGYGIVHYSSVDAVFRTMDGKPVTMEFHRYCGPMFFLDDDGWWPDEDSPEWDNIWAQFTGWWEAKGKKIYRD